MRLVMPVFTGRDVNEHEWEFDWVSEVLPHPTSSLLCKSWGVGSSGGTDQGILTYNRYTKREFKLKVSALLKGYDDKYTENSKK